jgi:PEGA domain-containing protein
VSREPNPRRFAIWAVALVLPLVLAAVALPWIRRALAPGGGQPVAGATTAARAAEAAAAERARRADDASAGGGGAGAATASGAEAPRRPDGPTTDQIEAARRAQEALIEAQRGWKKVETMAPREARRDASGELVAPFQGFGLSVESSPPGAVVRVGGREVGETPLVTTVDCRPGEAVEVRVERRPLKAQVRTVRCRADALLTVKVTLSK